MTVGVGVLCHEGTKAAYHGVADKEDALLGGVDADGISQRGVGDGGGVVGGMEQAVDAGEVYLCEFGSDGMLERCVADDGEQREQKDKYYVEVVLHLVSDGVAVGSVFLGARASAFGASFLDAGASAFGAGLLGASAADCWRLRGRLALGSGCKMWRRHSAFGASAGGGVIMMGCAVCAGSCIHTAMLSIQRDDEERVGWQWSLARS